MNFRNGYLGACIVVLGVIATIIGSYALSIEVTDEEVTQYSYVADLNGLFDSEQAPAYIEYIPSTNYTGYYTDSSTIGDKRYFAGVDYAESAQPNAYRLNLQPVNSTTGTLTLSGDDWTDGAHVSFMAMATFPDDQTAGGVWGVGSTGTNATLSSIIEGMNLDEGINYIEFSSIAGRSALSEPYPQADILELDWVLFSSKSMWLDNALRVQTQNYMEYKPEAAEYKPTPIYLGCIVNLDRNLVTFYTDNDLKMSAGQYNIEDVIVSFGGSATGRNVMHLGTQMNYNYGELQPATYMDIRAGVAVEGDA